MTTEIQAQETTDKLHSSLTEFVSLLKQYREEDFNRVPFAGSWTPGEVAEHVLKSSKGALVGLNGPDTETDRDPAQLLPHFEQIFLDFSTKMQSPDFILPSGKSLDQQQIITELENTFSAISESATSHDLTRICTGFKFPGSGHVTRLELLHFLYVHTKRHSHQLQKIAHAFE